MKNPIWTTAILVFLGGPAQATTDVADAADAADAAGASATQGLKRVDKFRVMRSIDGWRPLDRNTLIIWASPFKPYLVQLSGKSFGLRHAFAIGVTSTVGSVHERFDSVIVDGMRYPIEAIYELDKETARQMKGRKG